jgi:hypothetical protein
MNRQISVKWSAGHRHGGSIKWDLAVPEAGAPPRWFIDCVQFEPFQAHWKQQSRLQSSRPTDVLLSNLAVFIL